MSDVVPLKKLKCQHNIFGKEEIKMSDVVPFFEKWNIKDLNDSLLHLTNEKTIYGILENLAVLNDVLDALTKFRKYLENENGKTIFTITNKLLLNNGDSYDLKLDKMINKFDEIFGVVEKDIKKLKDGDIIRNKRICILNKKGVLQK